MNSAQNHLKLKSLGIDTYRENIIFMRADNPICVSEGFTALTRMEIRLGTKSIIATLDVVHSNILEKGEAALSEIGFKRLEAKEGDFISVYHMKPIVSLSDVRAKMYRKKLDADAYLRIISDVTQGLYSNIELSAFIASCSGDNMDLEEIIGLTMAMIRTGSKLEWGKQMIVDKHCVGGLPGNRTTPIVVSIVAAAGLVIPKTSSRAITSPAGTADAMETVTNVDLSLEQIRAVVMKEGACLAWGGSVNLSPADDILITVEKSLDIDSEGQMIASVLSKKAAAGATHVVIDIPVGHTAKVRTEDEALKLEYYFKAVGKAIGMDVEVLITDGSQPVGRGIGPALEAMDFLSVLRNASDAPADLKDRSLKIAALMLEHGGKSKKGEGEKVAKEILESGAALKKFEAICLAQGGMREPVLGHFKKDIVSECDGIVSAIDNRKLAKVAKLAGAPKSASAGVYFCTPIGTRVLKGQTLFTIFSEAEGELQYAVDFLHSSNHIFQFI